jgi:ribosome-associated toxin RatA of RatAB toxin-antitoxin module
VEIRATLDSSCAAEVMRSWVNDLGRYPQWLSIVSWAEVVSADGEAQAWAVELRAKVGPLARSKKLRMERVADTPDHVRFERRETDGRDHSSWVLDGEIEPLDSGCRLTMLLHYGGAFGGGLVERLLRDAIESSKQKLRVLVESASPTP